MPMNRTFARGASILVGAVEAFLDLAHDTGIDDEPIVGRVRQALSTLDDDPATGWSRLMMDVDGLVDMAAAYGWGGTGEFEAMDLARDEARAATLVAMAQEAR